MANYPINIWVINEDEFDEFTYTGGKVIYIAEEISPRFQTHPAIITAGGLLPPMDAIRAELDGSMFECSNIYEQYLQTEEADPFISIIIAAGLRQIPIGIMFGKDEMNFQFPKMFIDFMYRAYGVVFGLKHKVQPYIIEDFLPIDLTKLYLLNIIDYKTFMEMHPQHLPIQNMAILKMVNENRPPIKNKDMNGFIEYFEMVKNAVQNNGGKFLVEPLEGIW